MVNDLTGSTIGRYLLDSRLGHGGMGEVYKATDTTLKRPVALKRLARHLSEDNHGRYRLVREAQHAAKLTNQHIAAVHDVIEDGDEIFLVMEYVDGQTLQEAPARPLDLDTFLDVATQCAEALVAAHEEGILHHDIKPGNIMVNSHHEVKVLDFGVARQLPTSLQDATTRSLESDESESVQGTPAYMAPQVLLGKEIDPRADIFSMGIVFYELLTGHHPFLEETVAATADHILHNEPVSIVRLNPRVPEGVDHIVEKMLAKDPEDRYASAADLLVDLRRMKKEQTGEITTWTPARRFPRSRKTAFLLAGFVALFVLPLFLLLPHFWTAAPGTEPLLVLPALPTVVVLPFTSDDSDSREAAFARGFSESISRRLFMLAEDGPFEVVSYALARRRKVSSIDEAATEVGANVVLSGRVSKSGNQRLATLQLIEVSSGGLLKEGSASQAMGETLNLDFQIMEKALGMLAWEIGPRERRLLVDVGTENPAAYRYYLRGRGNMGDPKKWDQANEDLKQAWQLDPGFRAARIGLAEVALNRVGDAPGSGSQAREICSQEADRDPELVAAHLCLGDEALGRDDPIAAVEHFERALFLAPSNERALTGLWSAYRATDQTEKIEPMFRRALERRPDYWFWRSLLAVHLFRSANYKEAALEFEKVCELAPEYYRAFYSMGSAYAEMGKWEQAAAAQERSIAIQPTPEAFTNLGTAYFFQGEFTKAVERFQTAVVEAEGANRLDFTLYGNLADALYWAPGEQDKAEPQYRTAIEMARRSLQESPHDITILGRLAIYLAMVGEEKAAREHMNRALRLTSWDPETHFKAAQVSAQFKDDEAALEHIEKTLRGGILPAKVLNHPIFEALRATTAFRRLTKSIEDNDTTGG